MSKHDELISTLSSDLAPVTPVTHVMGMAMAWFLFSAVFVVGVTWVLGPSRPGAFAQLASEPRFLLETLLGVVSIAWVGLAAFRSAIPAGLTRKFTLTGLILMALWLAQYVIGFLSPALEPSALGKRGHCFSETLVYSLPPILAGVFLVRRLFPLRYVRTAMTLSLAAGMIPALYMQLACMYESSHILSHHVLPGLLMVFAGAAIATLWHRPN